MDTDAIDEPRHRGRCSRCSTRSPGCATSATWRRSSASSSGSAAHGLFGSYVDTDDRNSDRYLFHIVQGGLGLPDESLLPRRQVRRDPREVRRLPHPAARRSASHADAGRRGRDGPRRSTPGWPPGHWERAETRDVQKTYNLTHRSTSSRRCARPSTGTPTSPTSAAPTRRIAEVVRPAAVVPRAPLRRCSTRSPIEDWRDVAAQPRAARPRRRTSPTTSSRPTSTSTAAPSTAPPSCAPAGSAASRFVEGAIGEAVGKEYVARHFPPRVQGDDGRPGRQPARGLPRARSPALDWMTEETKQRAYEKLDTFRPKIGYPEKFRDYSALEVTPDDLIGNVAGGRGVRDRPRSSRKIGSPVDRDEWFMLPQTVNAYYNPGTNEICFPAGHPAEAVLQPRRRPGRELRRHRRGDRPRDRPRLRRPGRAVRRRRQPQRLVDRRRQGRLRGEVARR